MKPCDCKSIEEATQYLNEQGISFNNDSLSIKPSVVLLTIGSVDIKIPMSRFKQFAEWYLKDQNHIQNYRKGISGGWVCRKCGVVQNWEPDPAYPCGCEKLNHSS